MPRPKKFRIIAAAPSASYFKPRGIPKHMLEEIVLEVDELEAVRLADLEGLYQEDAAGRMKVSRQTFGNIIISAHKKIADALIHGKVLKIEGGTIEMADEADKENCDCGYEWTDNSNVCPHCSSPRQFRRSGRGRRKRQFHKGDECGQKE